MSSNSRSQRSKVCRRILWCVLAVVSAGAGCDGCPFSFLIPQDPRGQKENRTQLVWCNFYRRSCRVEEFKQDPCGFVTKQRVQDPNRGTGGSGGTDGDTDPRAGVGTLDIQEPFSCTFSRCVEDEAAFIGQNEDFGDAQCYDPALGGPQEGCTAACSAQFTMASSADNGCRISFPNQNHSNPNPNGIALTVDNGCINGVPIQGSLQAGTPHKQQPSGGQALTIEAGAAPSFTVNLGPGTAGRLRVHSDGGFLGIGSFTTDVDLFANLGQFVVQPTTAGCNPDTDACSYVIRSMFVRFQDPGAFSIAGDNHTIGNLEIENLSEIPLRTAPGGAFRIAGDDLAFWSRLVSDGQPTAFVAKVPGGISGVLNPMRSEFTFNGDLAISAGGADARVRFAFSGLFGADIDRDGVQDDADNCRYIYNPEQSDANLDGVGDACPTVPQTFAIISGAQMYIDDEARVLDSSNAPAPVANASVALTNIGKGATTGYIAARGDVDLRGAFVGDVDAQGGITTQAGTRHGALNAHVTVDVPAFEHPVPFGGGSQGDVSLEPGQRRTLTPGRYGRISAKARATLELTPGVYFIDTLLVEPSATIVGRQALVPLVIYIRDEFIHRGRFVGAGPASLYVEVDSYNDVVLDAAFNGTVVAPRGKIRFASNFVYEGAFFGHGIEVHQRSLIRHNPFSTALRVKAPDLNF